MAPIFFQNLTLLHFGHYHFASLWQKSEKTHEPIPRNTGIKTNEQTNAWTWNFKGPTRSGVGPLKVVQWCFPELDPNMVSCLA